MADEGRGTEEEKEEKRGGKTDQQMRAEIRDAPSGRV